MSATEYTGFNGFARKRTFSRGKYTGFNGLEGVKTVKDGQNRGPLGQEMSKTVQNTENTEMSWINDTETPKCLKLTETGGNRVTPWGSEA